MFNPNNSNEIVFPHFIPTTMLKGVEYTWRNTSSGAKMIGSFGLTTNTFLGGKCLKMGFVESLGFWACLNKYDEAMVKLCGFYLEDPDVVTAYGREVIQSVFPNNTIAYVRYDDIPKTKTDERKLAKLQKEAAEHGLSPQVIDNAAVETLKSLIEAAEFEEKQAVKETVKATPRNIANDLIKRKTEQRQKAVVKT